MVVRALLEGHTFDLQALAELFPDGGDPAVVRAPDDSEQYFLTTSSLDPLVNDYGALQAAASSLLARLIGVARLEDDSFRPVRFTGTYDLPGHDSGADKIIIGGDAAEARDRVQVTVITPDSIESRARVGVPTIWVGNNPPQPVPPPGPHYLALATTNPDLAELISLLGNVDQLSWVELYKAFEIIRSAVSAGKNGNDALVKQLAVTKNEISRFTHSANHPKVGGLDARHARQSSQPPTQPMTLADARHFVRDLAGRWIATL